MKEEPTRRGVMLDLILTNKQGLLRNVKSKGSFGCNDHNMVEFKILRADRRMNSKLAPSGFRQEDLDLFMDLYPVGEYHRIKPQRKEAPKKDG